MSHRISGIRLGDVERPPLHLNNTYGHNSKTQESVKKQDARVESAVSDIAPSVDLYKSDQLQISWVQELDFTNANPVSVDIDAANNVAILTGNPSCYAWKLNGGKADLSQFYTSESNGDIKALLVAPCPGTSEPGVVIVDCTSGSLAYYESLGSTVTDRLLNWSTHCSTNIALTSGETITQAESVGTVGIAAATSTGRLFLISLRDAIGKSSISVVALRSHQKGFLNNLWDIVTSSTWARGICAIRGGPVLSSSQSTVLSLTSDFSVAFWLCGPDANARLLVETSLHQEICSSVSMLYPEAKKSLEAHSMAVSDKDLNILASFLSADADKRYYLVICLSLNLTSGDSNGPRNNLPFLVIKSTHRLQTYSQNVSKPPQLYWPEPFTTLFLVFEDALVALDSDPPNFDNDVVPRWENIISLKPSAKIFGVAAATSWYNLDKSQKKYTSEKASSEPKLLIATNGALVLVRRLTTTDPNFTASGDLKRLLTQVIYYSRPDSPFDFDLHPGQLIDAGAAGDAVEELAMGIASSTRPLANGSHSYLEDNSLLMRIKHLSALCSYVKRNFSLPANSASLLVSILQMLETALTLRVHTAESSKLNNLLESESALRQFQLKDYFETNVLQIADLVKILAKTVSLPTVSETSSNAFLAVISACDNVFTDTSLVTASEYRNFGVWYATNDVTFALERLVERAITRNQHTDLYLKIELVCANRQLSSSENYRPKFSFAEMLMYLAKAGDLANSVRIAKRFKLFKELGAVFGSVWSWESSLTETGATKFESFVRESIDDFGVEFTDSLISTLLNEKSLDLIFDRLLPRDRRYVTQFFEKNIEKYAKYLWILDLTSTSPKPYSTASQRLRIAVGNEPEFNKRKVLASLSKLNAIAAGDAREPANARRLMTDADVELSSISIQQDLCDSGILEEIRVTDSGNPLHCVVHELSNDLHKRCLAQSETIDLLTFLPHSGSLAYRLGNALSMAWNLEDRIRLKFILEQLFLETDWDIVKTEIEFGVSPDPQKASLIARVVKLSNLSARIWFKLTEQPISRVWSAAVSEDKLKQMYPQLTMGQLEELLETFLSFEIRIHKMVNDCTIVPIPHAYIEHLLVDSVCQDGFDEEIDMDIS